MTAAHLWSLLLSLPVAAQSALVLAAALLLAGIVVVSLTVGRAVAWADERALRRRRSRAARPVDPFVRVLRLSDAQVEREFAAIVEASADDPEAVR